jgi:hypothetical protein
LETSKNIKKHTLRGGEKESSRAGQPRDVCVGELTLHTQTRKKKEVNQKSVLGGGSRDFRMKLDNNFAGKCTTTF